MIDDPRREISDALARFATGAPLGICTAALFESLGYRSDRTLETGNVEEFLNVLDAHKKLTPKQLDSFQPWQAVEVVFQFTGEEINQQQARLFGVTGFDHARIESFLFLAVELGKDEYSRTLLAETTRAVNRLFRMPVIIVFRYGPYMTLSAIHRRPHKIDGTRDVLEKVTLIKDIRAEEPHRAHIDILAGLALPEMIEAGVDTFEKLHSEWERVLDIEYLNRRFYHELFVWFERTIAVCRFPDDGAGEGSDQRHVIRLITRLLFIWFMKEKGLIPDELFEEHYAHETLTDHAPDKTDYYRAVLQNLFFATLNTPIDKRAFINTARTTHRDFSKYHYRKLLTNANRFVESLDVVPFVNGGLFDCLDEFESVTEGVRRIDAFTDQESQGKVLHVPAHVFFDSKDGLFPLFQRYKFTVEENTPLDREVALDPELLGRVFENLLAAYNPETRDSARKSTGSYYTPRQVVDYMVREVLTEALATKTQPEDGDKTFWRERLQYLLDHSDAMDDADELFEEVDRRTVVNAIAGIRVLDPAVGSGAFPMGILQALTLALRRLDPDNTLWEELQKKRAKTRASDAFDTRNRERRDEMLGEISAMFEKYRKTDFGRKLYLIQNSIYGVDIQPTACQIAKLRFFISLVIEQEPDKNAPNYGINPLPNLDTRFVAADALLDLERHAQMDIGEAGAIDKLRQELAANREQHFLTVDRRKKLKLQEEDTKLRNSLAKKLQEQGWGFNVAQNIANWDPYDQNAHADWFDPEHMFGVSEGFDVVIGNPPYIQLQKEEGRARKKYQNANFETFASTGDIYQLFYERGCGLLKPGAGSLAFITSNSWLKAKYGGSLRSWFAKHHTPLSLVEMGKDVFDAIVDTAVLIVRNGKQEPVTCQAVDIEHTQVDQFPPPAGDWGTLVPEGDRPWMALSAIERTVMEKMEALGTPLKDWDISIYYGIKTGYNEAFIVDQETRDELVSADPRSAEILKPVLRGRDIARYRANWAGMWLISTFPSLDLDIDGYPAIKRYLLSFGKERLAQEGRNLPGGVRSRKKTSNAWYELQDTCAYHEEFGKPKLFWMHMAPEGRFALEEANIMCNQKCFMATGENLDFLCAVLNCRLVTWLVRRIAVTTGMGLTQWDKFMVESIPVFHPDCSVSHDFRDLMKSMLTAIETRDSQEISKLQQIIDHKIYKLYDLQPTEIECVLRG